LVEVRREGRSSRYRLERERLLRVVGGWLANLRPPTPEQKWLSAGPSRRARSRFDRAARPRSPNRKESDDEFNAQNETPKIFRITLEVSNLDEAAAFYARLLGNKGKRHPAPATTSTVGRDPRGARPTVGGLTPTPGAKSLYFAVRDLEAVHTRARGLKASRRTRCTASPVAR